MSYHFLDDGHVSSPQGYRATGVSAGLKDGRARDLALIHALRPCRVAAIFTRNAVVAAPIFFNQAILARSHENTRAVLINAGQANAATGPAGLADAVESAKVVADELEIPRDSVLLMSTGQIGVPLPMPRMREGIRRAASELDSGGGRRAAIAILTNEARPKERALRVALREGHTLRLGGMAKGSRFSMPRQGTVLALVTTDAMLDQRLLMRALDRSFECSFGRILIDGESSPNDGVILLANGAAGGAPILDATSWEYGAFQEALDVLCSDLAQQVVRDAASGGKQIVVHVRGALSAASARQVATAVGRSPAGRRGCAPARGGWGGLLFSCGGRGVEIPADLLDLRIGPVPLMSAGVQVAARSGAITQALAGPEIEIGIDLHLGTHQAEIWACTLPGEGIS